MVCAQPGNVTGTEIVSIGTGQSHAIGLADTAETVTVVIMIAETDHADTTGTIGTHQSRPPTKHSACASFLVLDTHSLRLVQVPT